MGNLFPISFYILPHEFRNLKNGYWYCFISVSFSIEVYFSFSLILGMSCFLNSLLISDIFLLFHIEHDGVDGTIKGMVTKSPERFSVVIETFKWHFFPYLCSSDKTCDSTCFTKCLTSLQGNDVCMILPFCIEIDFPTSIRIINYPMDSLKNG